MVCPEEGIRPRCSLIAQLEAPPGEVAGSGNQGEGIDECQRESREANFLRTPPLTLCATSSLSLAPGAHPVDASGPGLAYSSDVGWSHGVEANGQRNNLERQVGLALGVLWLGSGTPQSTLFALGRPQAALT